MRFACSILLILVLLFVGSINYGERWDAHAVSQAPSQVYVSPLSSCCGTPNSPYQPNDVFTINVNLNLSSGESINGFDVRLNYSNAHTALFRGVVQALSISYSGNVFSSYQSNVLVECIDDISVIQGGSGCPSDDSPSPGQVHLVEGIIGQTLAGPQSGTLFSVTFKVWGLGNSTFLVDRANLVNPHSDPSNPQATNARYIPVLKYGGIFGNQGVIAFFNFQPFDTSVSPAVLPNQPVVFDASGSFVPTNSSMRIRTYSWNFGDGKPVRNVTTTTTAHTFSLPGNYSVSLKVWDFKNDTGSLTRTVSVLPALGNLVLTVEDQMGTVLRGNVFVRVFNSSSSPIPFVNKAIDHGGNVQFNGLTPGPNYYLTFSGPTVENNSKTESILPGWTTQDTVYLSLRSPPPDYSGIVYIGTILGGLGLATAAIIYKKRFSPNESGHGSNRRSKRRA